MKKIKLLTLEGCSGCAKLKNNLTAAGLQYKDTVCGRHNQFCDEIENITKCEMYPIVILNDSLIVCLTDDYSMIDQYKKISNINVLYKHSIDSLFDFIKKY